MQYDDKRTRYRSSRCLLTGCRLAVVVSLPAATSWADGVPPPPRQRAERLTFDPEQNRWIRTADPVPGTEDGDLDIVRQWLARDDFKTARKAVKRWIKTYGPESGRYPEALYLKGTA